MVFACLSKWLSLCEFHLRTIVLLFHNLVLSVLTLIFICIPSLLAIPQQEPADIHQTLIVNSRADSYNFCPAKTCLANITNGYQQQNPCFVPPVLSVWPYSWPLLSDRHKGDNSNYKIHHRISRLVCAVSMHMLGADEEVDNKSTQELNARTRSYQPGVGMVVIFSQLSASELRHCVAAEQASAPGPGTALCITA